MTRVALFGGSFNPPHVAHELVALYVLETQPVDELWFLPVYQHVFDKNRGLAPFEDRVAMCQHLADALGTRAKVSRAEEALAQQPGFQGSRTFDLLEMLTAADPTLELRWVVGSDILGETDKWYRWPDVIARAPLIVLERPGYPTPPEYVRGLPMPDVSSTRIREALAAGRDLRALLPTRVLEYIESRKLYA
ncbi:MAG: nicotinate (nicotinamide) nucleotide adenylyltransferase [Deltaproteobacteria bacterium]|nr:nicotinate (nicotinamide) nucleotide adenylyltransferase [Deltaproteobacteria bacterium]